MKRSTKVVLISVVSLGLAGIVAARQFDGPACTGGPGGWMTQKIAWKLDLDEAQRTELDELGEHMIANMKEMREQRPSTEEMQSVLGERFDRDQAKALLDQRLQNVQERAPEMITAIARFYDALDANQKQQLAKMIERRMEWGGHHWGGRWMHGER